MPYSVYVLASKSGVLYVGVTSNMSRRIREHHDGLGSAFTARYRVRKLVYFQEFQSAHEAICREKQLKRWRREKKERLIELANPDWKDLSTEIAL